MARNERGGARLCIGARRFDSMRVVRGCARCFEALCAVVQDCLPLVVQRRARIFEDGGAS